MWITVTEAVQWLAGVFSVGVFLGFIGYYYLASYPFSKDK